jgi:hypothetical protein
MSVMSSHWSIVGEIPGRKMKNKMILICLLATSLLTTSSTQAQQPKISRVGILFVGGRDQPHLEALKKGLSELGYTEGKNIILRAGRAQGNKDDSDCHDQRKSGGARTRR